MTAHRRPKLWPRLRRKFRDQGPLYAAQRIFDGIVPRRLFELRRWVVSSADLSTFADAEVPDAGARWANEANGDASPAPDGEYGDLEDCLARGEPLAVVERDGKAVAWHSFATQNFILNDWLWLVFRDREVYSMWSFVEPEHRGQGLAGRLTHFAYRDFARLKYLRAYSVIDVLNRSALRASSKMCHRRIGRITYLRCCGFTIIRIGGRFRAGLWSTDNPLLLALSQMNDS